MANTLRNRLLAAKLPSRLVTVELEDGAVEVEVRGLSQGVRARVIETCLQKVTDEDGNETTRTDQGLLAATLVLLCSYVPGTDERVFEEADREAVSGTYAPVLDPIVVAATDLSGLKETSRSVAEGNSVATPAATSPSSSPAS